MAMAAEDAMAASVGSRAAKASIATPGAPTPISSASTPTTYSGPNPGSSPNVYVSSNVYSSGKFGSADYVIVLGLALILVSGLTNGSLKRVVSGTWTGNVPGEFKTDIITIGGELIFVVILGVLAQSDRDVRNVIVVFLIGLWAVWLMMNQDKIIKWSSVLTRGASK